MITDLLAQLEVQSQLIDDYINESPSEASRQDRENNCLRDAIENDIGGWMLNERINTRRKLC